MKTIIICGPGNTEDYDPKGVNSPSGKCKKHGFYLYFCQECHDEVDSNA